MSHNLLSVISAMAEVAERTPKEAGGRPKRPVITISRDLGSGGDEIARRLADRLGLELFDEKVLTEVAARLEDDPAIVRMIDEGFGRAKDMWLYRLFSGNDIGPDTYRDTLIKVVMSLGRLGGVIVGRGAHVILAESCALRLRIAGSEAVCAHRVMAEKGIGEAEAKTRVHDTNHRRGKFVWDVFHSRLSDASQFDMTLNSDRVGDFGDLVETLADMATAIHAGKILRADFMPV